MVVSFPYGVEVWAQVPSPSRKGGVSDSIPDSTLHSPPRTRALEGCVRWPRASLEHPGSRATALLLLLLLSGSPNFYVQYAP